jgi:uncharacterized membrane protein YeaQ/YmgE (transglycosylase-associated protein family)
MGYGVDDFEIGTIVIAILGAVLILCVYRLASHEAT